MRYSIDLTSTSSFSSNSLSKVLEIMKLDEEYVLRDHLYGIIIPIENGRASLDMVDKILDQDNRESLWKGGLAPSAASLISAGILGFDLSLQDADMWDEILTDYQYRELVMDAVHKSIVTTIESNGLLDYYVGHSDNIPEAITIGEITSMERSKAEGVEVRYNLIDTRYSVKLPMEDGELVFSELVDYIECGEYLGELEERFEETISDLIHASIIDVDFRITNVEGWAWLVESYS